MPGFRQPPLACSGRRLAPVDPPFPPLCSGHKLFAGRACFLVLTEHLPRLAVFVSSPFTGFHLLAIPLGCRVSVVPRPELQTGSFGPGRPQEDFLLLLASEALAEVDLRRSGASAKLPMKPALGVLPYVGFTEAGWHTPPPYLRIIPVPPLQPSRSACFTMSPFLPQSRSLKWQSPPPSEVVGGAKRAHAVEKAVGLELRFPPYRNARDEDLAVTRSRELF